MYIFDGPELQSFGVGADLLQGIQNILEGRALIFGDDAVLGETIFYVILYHIGKRRYGLHIRALTGAVCALAAARIGLCLFPQNAWLSANPPLSWGIWRNVPFALLGALVIVVFLRGARQAGDRAFRWMWLAIVLSFAFYIPVVLWADVVPLVGMLMIPKTCAYVWVVWMGFSDMHRKRKETVK